MRRTHALVVGIVAIVALGACEKVADTAAVPVAKGVQLGADHELGRQVYNFRCYYCHGYSGDARTLAATFLNPVPRNFTTASPDELPKARMIAAIANGREGTAMKGFAGIISSNEIAAVAKGGREDVSNEVDLVGVQDFCFTRVRWPTWGGKDV